MAAKKHHTPEQIIHLLRQAEVELAGGQAVPQMCRKLGVSEQTYYRWRKEYGGIRTDQAKWLRVSCHITWSVDQFIDADTRGASR